MNQKLTIVFFFFFSDDINLQIRLLRLDHLSLQAINDYDLQIHKIDRKSWIADFIQKYQGVAALDNKNNICGYGILKESNGIFSFSPLLADSLAIARVIARHLLKMIPRDKMLEVPFYKENSDAMELAKQLGLQDDVEPLYQMFTKQRFIVPIQRVFFIMAMSNFA